MNYRDFNLDDWIGHISGVIEDETTLDGNEMRDLVEFLTTLKQYPTTKNDLGVDCISRKLAIRELKESAEHHANDSREEALLRRDRDIIKALPPVTPIRPKGHWIYDYISADGHRVYHCSECGCYLKPKTSEYLSDYKWCSLCGAEMKESEEE